MESKTLEELRGLARAAGIRGYSSMRKKDLIELLKKSGSAPTTSAKKARPTESATSKKKTAAKKRPTTAKPTQASPTPSPTAQSQTSQDGPSAASERADAGEQHIEDSKYALTPRGIVLHQDFAPSNLQEDIDRLPELNEPVLCLLPQKPGVVHAYWILQRGTDTRSLKLRLSHAGDDGMRVLEEIPVNGERGHWYFHAPQDVDAGSYVAQLGYYDESGRFVSAIHRGIARIPTLYASNRTDRSWWIDEEQFRELYLRSGGRLRGHRLGWGADAPSSVMPGPSSRTY